MKTTKNESLTILNTFKKQDSNGQVEPKIWDALLTSICEHEDYPDVIGQELFDEMADVFNAHENKQSEIRNALWNEQ